ncbi:MAG TPA: outer membrane beta-barrel protein, partial [Flavisolibacter sp.]|nr:outer membrane beta-barrel protein [Flavisolibacter sp.]
TIHMLPSSKSLDEVMIIAERPPVSVRKDTIEFNASSFKTLPTALVEDMLKKLPGVQVDVDGNITVNGKRVNRILVDGKEFFGSDPKMATRNLPANVIDKIQVTEDKDQKDLNPDIAAGDIGQVINLKLKKGIKKGWFGKAYAGAGTDKRYEGGTILNLFRDTLQLSLIGFSNNLNRAGFGMNDIRNLGGFGRTGINMMMINSSGGININGISIGGMGEGINTSSGGGFNMNHVFRNGITLNTQYFYGQSRNDINELNNRQQFITDSILNTRSVRDEVLTSANHRFGIGLKGNFDSLTRFEFRPSLIFTDRDSDRETDIRSESNYKGLLNRSINLQDFEGKDAQYDHYLTLFKNFRKKGRSLNISNTINHGRVETDQINETFNTFYNNGNTNEFQLNQLRDRYQKNLMATFNANYNEPISKAFSVRLGYTATHFYNDDLLLTFNKSTSGKYDELNPNLTNELGRKSWRNVLSAALSWKYKQLTVTATGFYQALDIWNNFSKTNQVEQHYQYLLPGLTINWKDFRLNYSTSVNPPNITDLQPVPDNTNPLFITEGNPDLLPSENHSINFNFFKNLNAKSLTINAYMHGNIRNNSITRSREVLSNGVQRSRPINVDGVADFYTNFFINKQYKFNKNFQVSFGGGYNFNLNRNYLIVNNNKSYVNTTDFGPSANGSFNWRDIIEWNFRYSIGLNSSKYESNAFNDIKTTRHNSNTEVILRWLKNLVWETSLNYVKNPLTAPGVRRDIALWNAGLTFVFLKDQKGLLKFSVSDLLDQNAYVFRNTTENIIIDRQLNNIQRYFMTTFTYNIRNFKAGKIGGRERLFMF